MDRRPGALHGRGVSHQGIQCHGRGECCLHQGNGNQSINPPSDVASRRVGPFPLCYASRDPQPPPPFPKKRGESEVMGEEKFYLDHGTGLPVPY
jgi:hypothetical protein